MSQSIAGLLVAILISLAVGIVQTADPISSLATATIEEISKTLDHCGDPPEPYSKGEYDVTCNYGYGGTPNLLDVTCRGTRDTSGSKKAERETVATAAREAWLTKEKPMIDDVRTYKQTIKNAIRNLIYDGMTALCPPTPAGTSLGASKELTKFYEYGDAMETFLRIGLRKAVLSHYKSGNANKQIVGKALKEWATVPLQADGLAKTMADQAKAVIQAAKKCEAKDSKTHDLYCAINGKPPTPVFLQAVCHGEARGMGAFTSSGTITDAIINNWLSQSQNRPAYFDVSLPSGLLPSLVGAALGKLCTGAPPKGVGSNDFKAAEFATIDKLAEAVKTAAAKTIDELKTSDDPGKQRLYMQLLQDPQEQ